MGACLLSGLFSAEASAAQLPPSSLSATATSSSGIALRWADPNTSERGYVVERSLTPSGFRRVATLAPNAVNYTDGSLAAGTTYFYRVTTRGTSRHSGVASATTLTGGSLPTPTPRVATPTPRPTATAAPVGDKVAPSVPTGLSGSAPDCTQVKLSWKPSVDTGGSGLKGYRVYRNGAPSGIGVTASLSATDAGVGGGAVYNYSVAAVDNAGNQSPSSSAVVLNTPTCPATGGPFAERFGGSGSEIPQAVAVDSAGNIVVVGEFRETATFGGAQLASAGGADVFVARYSPSGAHLWSKRLGGAGDDGASAVAIDDQGAIFVAGYFQGASIDLGGGARANAGPVGTSDGFVVKYSAAGQHLWSSRLGGTDADIANGISVGSDGDPVVVGMFRGTAIDFGGRSLSSTWGGQDGYIVKLSGANGANIWARNVNCGGPDMAEAVAVDGSGNVFVTGEFAGNADFGNGAYLVTAGFNDAYLAKYSSTGTYLWAKKFGDQYSDTASAVAVDAGGNVAITGSFLGSVNFGGGTLTTKPGAADIFVARYTASGTHIWSKSFGNTFINYGLGIGADADGTVVVTGTFYGTVNLGGASLATASPNYQDIFVAEFAPSGAHLWSQRYGGTDTDQGHGVAFGPNGAVVTGDYLSSSVDFGGGPSANAGWFDGFLLSLGR
jgi:hypothetical protein